MDDVMVLVVVTWLATAVSVVVGKGLRTVVRRVASSLPQQARPSRIVRFFVDDFTDAMTASFILVVSTFEKVLPLVAGHHAVYFAMTFACCVAFSRVFDVSPSPCAALHKHWRAIKSVAFQPESKSAPPIVVTLPRAVIEYFKFGFPSICGLYCGMLVAVAWLKLLWDGMLTSHHVTNLHLFDICLKSLNTNIAVGFLVETAVTFSFLEIFCRLDRMSPQVGVRKLLNSRLVKDMIKSAIVTITLYFLINITGSFGNPFLAYVIQRHCLTDVWSIFEHVVVYLVGPFLASILHNYLKDTVVRTTPKEKLSP